MDLPHVLSTTAAAVALPAYVAVTRASASTRRWWVPAALCAGFLVLSLYAVADGGPFGFWAQHVGSPWQSQIFLDLLLMGGVAWFALQPRLRAAGVRPLPWLLLVLATGSIGMLALVARLLHAQHRAGLPEETRPVAGAG